MFVGRKEEIEFLKEKLSSDSFELGVVYGQRRIGKTSLIIEAISNFNAIYFLCREDGLSNNIGYFTEEFCKKCNLPYKPGFKTFDELFNAILANYSGVKATIVIDEVPFLAKVYPGITSLLQNKCDELKRNGSKIKIILSGSDVSFMTDLLENEAKPLYQRSTFKIHLGELCFSDSVSLLGNVPPEDKAKYLSIFGNRPYYLEKINQGKTFDENIRDLCFNKNSILTDAPNLTLPFGYSSNPAFITIMGALSKGKNKIKNISDALDTSSNATSTYLNRMMNGESIKREETFNGNKKTTYYQNADPFIDFYYRLINPNLPEIEIGLGEQIYNLNQDIIAEMINHGFEKIVISYIEEKNKKGLLPSFYHQFKRYYVDNSKIGRSIEIDGVASSLNEEKLLVIEAKFKNKDISAAVIEHLKESCSIFSDNYKTIDYYLFSKSGFADDIKAIKDKNLHLLTLKDMFQ